jgi:hypothetical protein
MLTLKRATLSVVVDFRKKRTTRGPSNEPERVERVDTSETGAPELARRPLHAAVVCVGIGEDEPREHEEKTDGRASSSEQ